MSDTACATLAPELTIQGKVANFVQIVPGLAWFFKRGYTQGVFWFIMISLVSVTNDVLMKYVGGNLHPVEISFFRFLFSMISVLPFMAPHGLKLFKTSDPSKHVWRAIIGAGAIGACCFSVNLMPLAENTTIMFAEPLFMLPMAVLLLKEKVDSARWIATIIGFFGLLIIVQPGIATFNVKAFIPMTAAFLFVLLNVLAKIMVNREEHTLTMLFYFGLGTSLVAGAILPWFWTMPTLKDLMLLALLGVGANMIQVCLFRAFAATDASGLMPFRYTELLFSAAIGFFFFAELPTKWILVGGSLIVLSNFYITYREMDKEKVKN
jgi:drug/metabolite transporter (DMT)-like permease